jgi:tRNA(fMet)-specific endonuclease VapC
VTRYMLDTNVVSHLMRLHPAVSRRVAAASMASLCISAITAGELVFGLAKRPDAIRLHRAVEEFLRRVEVLPWDSEVARRYGGVRAGLERGGKVLAALDLLIATHALYAGRVLVTNDRAFRHVPNLDLEDWTD